MSKIPLGRRLGAEAVGTGLLLAAVVGSGIMAERLAGGNGAVALLANTLATGAMLFVLVTALGPISGAHLNPAVSLVFAIRGELPRSEFAAYVATQVAAAVAGVVLAHLMFELPVVQASAKMRTGPAQWLSEAVATFGLVGAILLVERSGRGALAAAVGLYIAAAYWFTASTSFANPAVTIARALSNTFTGIDPAHVPAFIVAQIAGALAGAAILEWLTQNQR